MRSRPAELTHYAAFYMPPEKLRAVWAAARPFLDAALAKGHGEYWLEDIIDALLERRMQLWVVMAEGSMVGAAVTEVVRYPRLAVLQVVLLGGERMIEWYQAIDAAFVDAAQRFGCQEVRTHGRKGWARTMPWAGYEQSYVVMSKRIDR